jgi:hypothetical protein
VSRPVWEIELTVEFHGDPPLPEAVAQDLLDRTIDAVNEIGYVSGVRVLSMPDAVK